MLLIPARQRVLLTHTDNPFLLLSSLRAPATAAAFTTLRRHGSSSLAGRPATRRTGKSKASSPSLNSALRLRRPQLGSEMSAGARRQTAAPSGGRSLLTVRSCNKVSPFRPHQAGGGVTISRVTSRLLMNPSGQHRPHGSHHADSREEEAPPLSYYSALCDTHTRTPTHTYICAHHFRNSSH